jgi:arylsulfatase A-like enzyme/Flp pilus assembly protein TadD
MSRPVAFSLVLVVLASLAGCRPAPELSAAAPYAGAPVILISIDTLRSDRLPMYGYEKVKTPNFDSLRSDSILFEKAYSHCPLTLPSHVSMLTGLLPAETGVRSNIGFRFDPSAHPTIPQLLKQEGYTTGAAVSAYVLRRSTGIGEAFDFYDDELPQKSGGGSLGDLQRGGGETVAAATRWISAQGDSPFFFMLHLFEPHTPYAAPEPFRSLFDDPYDAEIAAADSMVGELLASLKESGVYDRSIIIFTSDHGEGLGDHGEEEHGIFLYREAIQVPLVVKLPGGAMAGQSVATPVQHIDFLPTVAALTGAAAPAGLQGGSLVEIARRPTDRERTVFSESMYPRIHLGWSELRSVVNGAWHYIEAPRAELYDMENDPLQKRNVVAQERRTYAAMRRTLEPFRRELEVAAQIDPEEAAKLAALGYLGGTAGAATGPLPDPKDRIGDIALMRSAARAAAAGRLAEAIEGYDAVLQTNPRFTDAWTELARAYDQVGRLEDAERAYRRAIEIAPAVSGEVAISLASIYMRLNRFDDAAAHAELGLRSAPGAAKLLLADAALARGDAARAERLAGEALADPAHRTSARVLRARALVSSNRLEEAEAQVAEARRGQAAGERAAPLLDFVEGDIHARLDRPREAEAAFRRAMRDYPAEPRPYASLAILYLIDGRPADADRLMENLAKSNPSPATYRLIVTTFEETGEERLAARWRQRAATAR